MKFKASGLVSQVTLSQKAHPPTLSNAVKPYPLQLASTHFCCGLRSQVRPAYPSLKETNFQEANGAAVGSNASKPTESSLLLS